MPPPVADRGGFRVDTGSAVEISRWIFARAAPGLADLAQTIEDHGYVLKLCGSQEALSTMVPERWTVTPTGYFMTAASGWPVRSCPAGYTIDVRGSGDVARACIFAPDGEIAASGWAAETSGAFVYDRIVTAIAHRRRGLGGALMSALRACRRDRETAELLVATPEGRALYETLGWEAVSPYSTASIETV